MSRPYLAVLALAFVGAAVLAVVPRLTGAQSGPAAQATGSAAVSREPLTIFAGSASKPALDEAARLYRAETGQKIDMTFAGSGTVLAQVLQEHIGDLYIPGSDDYMDKAQSKGAVLPKTRKVLAYLVPAVLVAKGNPKNIEGIEDLARPGVRVVVGQKGAVCLGDAAEEMLASAGLLDKVSKQIISYGTSCEDVANSLVLGEADAIIGWDVYARQHPTKMQLVSIPDKYVRTRNIPGAVITWSHQVRAASAFLAFLTGATGRGIFAKHGYTVSRQSA